MPRRIQLPQIGTGGIVTDLDAFVIGLKNTVDAEDAIARTGSIEERFGWEYDGSVADSAHTGNDVWRGTLVLAGVTYTVTCDTSGNVYIHNAAGAGTVIGVPGSVPFRVACVYRGQVVLVGNDGTTPLRLYSGAAFNTKSAASSTSSYTQDQAILTLSGSDTFDAAVTPGAYIKSQRQTGNHDAWAPVYPRVLERVSSTVVSLEDIQSSASATLADNGYFALALGYAFPAVSVYSAGTVSLGAAVVTGVGTKFLNGDWGIVEAGDGVLLRPTDGSDILHYNVQSVVSDTNITHGVFSTTGGLGPYTDIPYDVTRRLPFTDACVYRQSLCGIGVKQFPSCLYVGPPDWNASLPPGVFPDLYDPLAGLRTKNSQDHLMARIPVPSLSDSDPNVAVLPTPGPLMVIKHESVYRVDGSYPTFSSSLMTSGIGCIDVRSAISVDEGQFFADANGVWWYTGGAFINLTEGRVNGEWRDLLNEGVDYVTLGTTYGHLLVSVKTSGGTKRAWWVHLPRSRKEGADWISKPTNTTPRKLFVCRVAGEVERLLGVQDDEVGRVIDYRPCISGRKAASDFLTATATADRADDDGTLPSLVLKTGTGICAMEGLEGEVTVLDVDTQVKLTDSDTAAPSQLQVDLISTGALETPDEITTTVGTIDADDVSSIRRVHGEPNVPGRQHQLRITKARSKSTETECEIPQVTLSVRDHRLGS